VHNSEFRLSEKNCEDRYLVPSNIMYADLQVGAHGMDSQPEKEGKRATPNSVLQTVGAWVDEAVQRVVGGQVHGVVIENLIIRDSIDRIGKADPANVQQIAASQLELLAGCHQIALAQSRRSFFWALVGSGLGLSLFLAAAAFALTPQTALTGLILLLSGAIIEVVVFVLYGRTMSQLSSFHSRLEVLQRYLLANSLCESLDGDERNKARAALIQEILRPQAAAT
jgi:hypothetical protein